MLQLAVYEAAATFDVVDVAAVIDAPVAQVAVGGQVALYGIDEAVMLAKSEIEFGIHARTSKDVVEKIERHTACVMDIASLSARHDVCLMGVFGDDDSMWLLQKVVKRLFCRLGALDNRGSGQSHLGLFQEAYKAGKGNVTIGEEDSIVWTIMTMGEALSISLCETSYTLCCSEDAMT